MNIRIQKNIFRKLHNNATILVLLSCVNKEQTVSSESRILKPSFRKDCVVFPLINSLASHSYYYQCYYFL